jgi:SNF2 family DNA or RNA helicase
MGEGMSSIRDWTYSDAKDPKKVLGEAMTIIKDIGLWKAPYTAREAIFAVEEGKKVIVFANYKEAIKEIVRQMEEYQEENPDFKFVKVDGSTSRKGVRDAVSQFTNDPDTQVFVGQTKAAGTGLNLQAATYTVFNDVYWSPFVHEQAEDRTRRIGQQRCTTVVYMLADAWMETQVWHFMNQKRNVIEKLQEGRDDPEAFATDFLREEGERLGIDEKLIDKAVERQEKEEEEFTKALEDE